MACLYYLNNLFGIKLIFLRSESDGMITFSIWVDATLFSTCRFLQTQQLEVRLVAIKNAYFSRTLPLRKLFFSQQKTHSF